MPYASTYGEKVYPFQSEELPPEEQAGVPMLTNIPKTAETAAGRGQDVYFLSDRPETEEFLAERTPERPYKQVRRDVRATKPSEEDLTGLDAWKEFKEGYLSKQPGFVDVENINPVAAGLKKKQEYLEGFYRGKTKSEIDALDVNYIKKLEKRADEEAVAEEKRATWASRNLIGIKDKFLTDWKAKRKEIEAAKREQEKPGQAIPAINPDTQKKQWYFTKTKAWGPEIAEGMTITQDAEGNAIYTPTSQAGGKAPAARPGTEKPGKKVSYVGWDKSGKETVERVDVDDTDSQSDLIGKGFVEKTKFDRMDMVDRKLAQREAMKRIGGGILLDRATAAKFLKEAGGNKEKARKLAREKGYTF